MAVVTGASGGIGVATALHLARAGAKVALVARREDKLLETKIAIEGEGGVAITVKADVTKKSEVKCHKVQICVKRYLRPNSHRTRHATRMQIGTFFL